MNISRISKLRNELNKKSHCGSKITTKNFSLLDPLIPKEEFDILNEINFSKIPGPAFFHIVEYLDPKSISYINNIEDIFSYNEINKIYSSFLNIDEFEYKIKYTLPNYNGSYKELFENRIDLRKDQYHNLLLTNRSKLIFSKKYIKKAILENRIDLYQASILNNVQLDNIKDFYTIKISTENKFMLATGFFLSLSALGSIIFAAFNYDDCSEKNDCSNLVISISFFTLYLCSTFKILCNSEILELFQSYKLGHEVNSTFPIILPESDIENSYLIMNEIV